MVPIFFKISKNFQIFPRQMQMCFHGLFGLACDFQTDVIVYSYDQINYNYNKVMSAGILNEMFHIVPLTTRPDVPKPAVPMPGSDLNSAEFDGWRKSIKLMHIPDHYLAIVPADYRPKAVHVGNLQIKRI